MFVINKLTVEDLVLEYGLVENNVFRYEEEAEQALVVLAMADAGYSIDEINDDSGEDIESPLWDAVTNYPDGDGDEHLRLDINEGECKVFEKLRERFDTYMLQVEKI